ncbi:hypothetical protein N752_29710 [Desulforamulus aquiferis]|nr:hypothetical protein N752_29710 [Desulforamulus aquiferis]
MKIHPIRGVELFSRMCRNRPLYGFNEVIKAIYYHHEAWDGSGYMRGLKGSDIPLAARIIAVADAYDAMTTDRPYRSALPKDAAITEIIRCTGKQFDPEIVAAFLDMGYRF